MQCSGDVFGAFLGTVESLESGFWDPFGKKPEKPRNLAWWTSRQLCTGLLRRNSQPQGNSSQCYFAKLIPFSLPPPEFLNTAVASFCIIIMFIYFQQASAVVQRIWLKDLDNGEHHGSLLWQLERAMWMSSGSKVFWVAQSIFCSKQTFKHWLIQPGPLRSYRWDLRRTVGELSKVTVDLVVVFLLALMRTRICSTDIRHLMKAVFIIILHDHQM